jgi:Flp pilus assembly protein TadD
METLSLQRIPRPFTVLAAGLLLAVAIPGCQPATQKPSDYDNYVAAEHALRAGDEDTAALELASAVKANPDLVMARIVLAQIYVKKADYREAEDQYKALTRLDEYNSSNFYGLGLSQQYLNELNDAKASYARAVELDPRDAKSAANLGAVCLTLGQTDEAIKYLDRATKLDSKSWYAWLNYGIALDSRERWKEAESAYRKAQELDSSQLSILYNLASNLIAQNRPAEAIAILKTLLERDDLARYHKRYGDALVLANHSDDAVNEYHAALRVDPHYYPAMNALGMLLITRYQKEAQLDDEKKYSAIDLWHQSLAVAPNQSHVQALLKQWEPRR